MEIFKIFDNVINKDFMTYDSVFNEIVDWCRFSENEHVLILSDDVDCLSEILLDILEKNKIIEKTKILSCRKQYVIEVSLYSYRAEKEITLSFKIVDINDFSYTSKGMRLSNIIIDVDAQNLSNVKLPFGEKLINEVLKPMLIHSSGWRKSHLSLLY